MLDSIKQACQNYYDDLPSDTLYTIGKSALFSFAVTMLFTKYNAPAMSQSTFEDFRRPLIAATYAVVASIVHALLTPVFKTLFGDKNQNKFHRECVKNIFDVALPRLLFLSAGRTDLVFKTILPINLFSSYFYLFPSSISLFDQSMGDYIRNTLNDWGFETPDDGNSTFIIFA